MPHISGAMDFLGLFFSRINKSGTNRTTTEMLGFACLPTLLSEQGNIFHQKSLSPLIEIKSKNYELISPEALDLSRNLYFPGAQSASQKLILWFPILIRMWLIGYI